MSKSKKSDGKNKPLQYPKGFTLSKKARPKTIEDERKYRVVLGYAPIKELNYDDLYEERAQILVKIFNFVSRNRSYFQKQHHSAKVVAFSDRIKSFLESPIEYSLARTRYYSIDKYLTGIDPDTGKAKTEFRSEERPDKGLYKVTIKTSINGV